MSLGLSKGLEEVLVGVGLFVIGVISDSVGSHQLQGGPPLGLRALVGISSIQRFEGPPQGL